MFVFFVYARKNIVVFLAPIFTELTNVQQECIHIIMQHLTTTIQCMREAMVEIHLRSKVKIHLSLDRIS
jgi:hypothetical protein